MLEVELDIFSGMPNPRWILSTRDEHQLLDRLTADPGQVSPAATIDEQFALGYRGLIVREIKSDDGPWATSRSAESAAFPSEFRIGSRPAVAEVAADWLLGTAATARRAISLSDVVLQAASEGIQLVSSGIDAPDPNAPGGVATVDRGEEPEESARFPTSDGEQPHSPSSGQAGEVTAAGATWWACPSNYFSPNADLFNRPENVGRNNCYCFASNHLAGVRYALPGRRGGRPATSITCGGVIDGLRADGWNDSCQTNGLTIVLVIWPGVDYHFYRLVTGGPYWWWGHKPGGTPAKYTDDCGHAIYQYNGSGYAPNNICRGYYTDFCGYFYQNNNTAFVA